MAERAAVYRPDAFIIAAVFRVGQRLLGVGEPDMSWSGDFAKAVIVGDLN